LSGTKIPVERPLRVLYMGSRSRLSTTPLNILLDHGVQVCGLMVAAPQARRHRTEINSVFPEAVPIEAAHSRRIPVYEIGNMTGSTVKETISACKADVIFASCYPLRFPEDILEMPTFGCFNLHPALLPKFRGPDPLFWIFYYGVRQTGVTVHRMTKRIDAGDMVAQSAWTIENGLSEKNLLAHCAEAGGRLFIEVLTALGKGHLVSRPQDKKQSSYFSWPDQRDRVITPERSAQWAYNFINGIGKRIEPLEFQGDGCRYRVKEAIDYTASGTLNSPTFTEDDHLWIQCNPGLLHITGYRTSNPGL